MDSALIDILAHYGVKGMRWGVKKTTTSHPDSSDHKTAQSIKLKGRQSGTRALSNKEIQDYMARLNLEKQFRSTTPSGKITAFISQLLGGVGRQQITTVANAQASRGIAAALRTRRS